MKSFTTTLSFSPITKGRLAGRWVTNEPFKWQVNYGSDDDVIIVNAGFVFDAASVPFPFSMLIPKVSAFYAQPAALHDWILVFERHRFSRREADKMFLQSMKALLKGGTGWAAHRRRARAYIMFLAVSAYGIIAERARYFKPNPKATT